MPQYRTHFSPFIRCSFSCSNFNSILTFSSLVRSSLSQLTHWNRRYYMVLLTWNHKIVDTFFITLIPEKWPKDKSHQKTHKKRLRLISRLKWLVFGDIWFVQALFQSFEDGPFQYNELTLSSLSFFDCIAAFL